MSKRIKILFTIPNFDTAGSGKVVYDLVSKLDKHKFQPEICCFNTKGAFFKEIEQLGVPIHIFKFTADYKPFLLLPFRIYKIYKFFKLHKFDIIHSWHWSSDFTEALAAKLTGTPYVYTKKAMGWGNKAWSWRSKLSHKIIVINHDMIPEFFSNMKHKVSYIPLGVDTNHFKILEKKNITPEGLKFKNDDFVIVTIANLVPVKGVEILLEAVNATKEDQLKVLVVGNDKNDYGAMLKQRFEGNSNIFFLGKKSDVRPYLAVASLFVIPTKNEGRREGLPIAPLEAMASQRIVIGSKIAGIKDLLNEFQDCLFEPNSVASLQSKVYDIMNLSVSDRSILEKKMCDIARQDFSLDMCMKKHEEFYINTIRNKEAH